MIAPTPASGYRPPRCPLCEDTGRVGWTRCRFCRPPAGPPRGALLLAYFLGLGLFALVVIGWHVRSLVQCAAIAVAAALLAAGATGHRWGRP